MLDDQSLKYFPGHYFRTYDPSTGRYIESDPIGLEGGKNTFVYVNGNPLVFSDFYGLTQEDLDRAVRLVKKYHPDIYNEFANVRFGNLPDHMHGGTHGIGAGTITISESRYAGCLNSEEQKELLETVYHEYHHSNQGLLMRAITFYQDQLSNHGIGSIHSRIIHDEANIDPSAHSEMIVDSTCENGCGR